MEKISGILKGSARVSSVDLDSAPPVRPGAPSIGGKPGRNTVADRVTLSKRAVELAAQDPISGRNPRDISRAKKVEELNKKFFDTRLKVVEKEIPQSQTVADQLFEAEDLAPVSSEDLMGAYEPEMAPLAPRLSIEA